METESLYGQLRVAQDRADEQAQQLAGMHLNARHAAVTKIGEKGWCLRLRK